MNVRAVFLLTLLLHAPAASQDFKRPEKMPKDRYVYGLPVVKMKEGSRVAALRFQPSGTELFVLAVNKRRVPLVTDFDGPQPETLRNVADSTAIHEALSGKGAVQLVLLVKRAGAPRGLLIEIEFADWDAGLVYHVKKWSHDHSKWVLPNATGEIGTEPFQFRCTYSELERKVEVADFERQRRDKDEKKKNPAAGLKSLESFRAVQRKLRIDEGSGPNGNEERDYLDSRRDVANRLTARSAEWRIQNDWFEYFRAAVGASGLDGGMNQGARGASSLETVKRHLDGLNAEMKSRLRAQAAAEAPAAFREKRYVDAAMAALLCNLLGDRGALKVISESKKAAFSASELPKAELDGWMGVLGGLSPLPPAAELKEGEVYRAEGKVEKAGAFTLVKSGDQSWVFEDKVGLKFDAGDTFLTVGFFDGKKPPATLPEELKPFPFLRLVVIR